MDYKPFCPLFACSSPPHVGVWRCQAPPPGLQPNGSSTVQVRGKRFGYTAAFTGRHPNFLTQPVFGCSTRTEGRKTDGRSCAALIFFPEKKTKSESRSRQRESKTHFPPPECEHELPKRGRFARRERQSRVSFAPTCFLAALWRSGSLNSAVVAGGKRAVISQLAEMRRIH